MTSRNFRNALQPGHTVHWYRIDSVLGQGGFGITYLAHDTNLDHPVAIKEFLPMEMAMREADQSVQPASQAHDERFRWGLDRFLAEARTLARFRHPSIVRVASVFEANNTAYMVMELERGETLHALLARERTLPEARLRPFLASLLDGLEVVHAAGFVHRDIKPANIILRSDGTPVLLDFGSARQAIGQQTRTLTTLISPGYAPYEQYLSGGDRQGPWTDIYSLAATVYRCIVGRPPVDALDRSEGLLKSERDLYTSVREIGEGNYSDAFLRAIDHGLRFRAADRPQTVAAWRREINGEVISEVLDTTTRVELPPGDPGQTVRTSAPATKTVKLADSPESVPTPATTPAASPRWWLPVAALVIGGITIAAWQWQAARKAAPTVATAPTPPPAQPTANSDLAAAPDLGPVPAPGIAPTPDPRATIPGKLAAARAAVESAKQDPVALAAAAEQFRAVLAVDAGNAEAQAGLGSIATMLAKRALDALRANDVATATATLATAEAIDPRAPLIAAAQQQLQAVRDAAQAVVTAPAATPPVATQPEAATPVVATAAPRPPTPAPEPAEPTSADTVAELLRLADADLRANRLTAPRDRNAADRFRQVLKIDPANARATAGLDDIADRFADLARSSTDRGAFDRATDYVERGRALRPSQPRWTSLKEEIERARRDQAANKAAKAVAPEAVPTPAAKPPETPPPPSPVAIASPPPAAEPKPALPAPSVASVRVSGIDADFKRFGLSEADVQAAVTQKLQAAGYQIGSGGIELKVELKYSHNTTTGIYSWATFVKASGTGRGGNPVQFLADDSGSLPEWELKKLRAILLNEVDQFVAANPGK